MGRPCGLSWDGGCFGCEICGPLEVLEGFCVDSGFCGFCGTVGVADGSAVGLVRDEARFVGRRRG